VANEEHAHVALPKLYGAPAYARPPVLTVVTAERPFDPDDLPIEAYQTDEERELSKDYDAETWTAASASDIEVTSREGSPLLRGRPFHLSAITRRIRRDARTNGR
jgi:hypothetical protein